MTLLPSRVNNTEG